MRGEEGQREGGGGKIRKKEGKEKGRRREKYEIMEKPACQEKTDPDMTRFVTMATDQQLFSIFIEDDILQSLLNVHTLLQIIQKPWVKGGRREG